MATRLIPPHYRGMPSSVIDRFSYDKTRQILSIWFVSSGDRYDYFDVDPLTADAFRAAPSKGRYFSSHIRDRFRSQWVPHG